jgi:RNA polymerase sigma-70 factor (ECF subfamily)
MKQFHPLLQGGPTVSDELSFRDLIGRVRKGDEQAASELVRRYEPAIRRAVRFRLTDPRLRRTCDSMDVCQSVLLSFFVRAASGQYDLDTPEQLLRLLTTMARNKLLNQARQQQAARRDNRMVTDDIANHDVEEHTPGPPQQVEARELLQEIHARLTPDELRLVEMRNQGHDWNSIARSVGGSPAALRQKLHRALARLSQQFGLEEGEDE